MLNNRRGGPGLAREQRRLPEHEAPVARGSRPRPASAPIRRLSVESAQGRAPVVGLAEVAQALVDPFAELAVRMSIQWEAVVGLDPPEHGRKICSCRHTTRLS